jgi:hypothetical protein
MHRASIDFQIRAISALYDALVLTGRHQDIY